MLKQIVLLGAAAWATSLTAQQTEPYPVIIGAAENSLAQPRMFADLTGWLQVGNAPRTNYASRLWHEGGKFLLESFQDGKHRLTVVADGTLVWRYDALANEYSYLKQDPDIKKAFAVAAAWARSENQRPTRLFAGSARWLVKPAPSLPPTDRVHLEEKTPLSNNDWRGTDLWFRFDSPDADKKMLSLSIEERLATPLGVRRAYYEVNYSYPQQRFNFQIEFKKPVGAKPAADLPTRIDG